MILSSGARSKTLFLVAVLGTAACGGGTTPTGDGSSGDTRGDATGMGDSRGDGAMDAGSDVGGGDGTDIIGSETALDGSDATTDASDAGDTGPSDGCTGGGTTSCGVGECRRTVQNCTDGHVNMCVPGMPTPEICDGLDNDCDGVVDNGLGTTTCGMGVCQRTVDNCVMGAPQTCVPGRPMPETCNGLDDDCDGDADDSMDLGTTTCGIGACQRTVQNCVAGHTQTCVPGTPTPEICNGIDDDCDGVIDNGLGTTTCGLGVCRRTVQNCVMGVMQMCMPGMPMPESCNGLDDDCDGDTDDSADLGTITCGVGACQRTVPACVMGVTQTCIPGMPRPEMCDGIDDNCDGIIDDGDPGGGLACMTGMPGICAAGTTHCQMAHIVCVPNMMPRPEVCNGLDDNCDGLVDNAPILQLCGAPPPHVMTVVCNGAMGCAISACAPGFYNTTGVYSDGCSCQDDTNAKACGSATNLGAVAVGGTAMATGKVVVPTAGAGPDAGEWFVVTFPTTGPATYGGGTPSITITPSPEFAFEVRSACMAGPLGCGSGSASATGLQAWSFTDNQSTAGANQWSGRSVAWPSTVYIRVFRTTPGPSCDGYTLTISR